MNNLYFISLLLFLILGNAYKSEGAIFTVSTQADAGTGSLREAITLSNNNGNSETDFIYFNLPGSQATDKTITLNSSLPQITTSLIIDGSSQPGATLSVNGAKIILQAAGPFTDAVTGTVLSRTDCFFVQSGAAVFEMYGMIIRNFYSVKPDGRFSTGTGVFADDAGNRLVIGSPGKGNVLYDNGAGLEVQGISDCVIKSNLIGIKENGLDFESNPQIGVGIAPGVSCEFGGETIGEGNIGFGSFSFGNLYDNILLKLRNNIFNANSIYKRTSNSEAMIKTYQFQVYVFSQLQPNINHPPIVLIDHNTLGCNLTVAKCNGIDLNINSNTFGTSPDHSTLLPIYNSAISIKQTNGRMLIGGTTNDLGNVFTNVISSAGTLDSHAVVETSESSAIELSHNSFYCNENSPFLYLDKGPGDKPVNTSITAITASSVTGIAKTSARIELFYADINCTGCQPQKFISSIVAGPDGKWIYNGALQPGYGVLATATLGGISSEFTDTKIYLGNVQIHDATCDNNGAISGINVANATQVQWLNEQDQVVGINLDLKSVPAGKYRLKTQQFQCTNYSPIFTINVGASLGINEAGITITDDQCDQQTGSIKNIIGTGGTLPYIYLWQNSSGQVIGNQVDLVHLGQGNYTLILTDADGCRVIKKTYSVANKDAVLTPPIINNIIACSSPVTIRVTNPVVATSYRLYKNLTDLNYIQENSSGIFNVDVQQNNTFYITQLVNSCESARIAVTVTVGGTPIRISNTFTPNGDGINDNWEIAGIENFPNAMVELYNRYGARVFDSKNYGGQFDGRSNGKDLPVGTYYYIIKLGTGCNIVSGSLTIIR
ncbi:gliding motility-associated C-terminal domain-containing protein [Mucilaginibacter polytrichastri]|uniref:gliding motility-associated C-terminal domain-containing protein n=1 Tax=Mucilaginibacter polytrichastri TaxID=1302689 RepID=UPI00111347ED|nr:gliding motility-associated C-terminal domain-containing protein [Mucilaginibacter polytrichastri]